MPRLQGTEFAFGVLNDNRNDWTFTEAISRALQIKLTTTIFFGLVVNLGIVASFGALYLAAGEDCYAFVEMDTDFGYGETFALSAHTFTTVGFGSIFPKGDCAGGQVLVVVEQYFALVTQLLLGAFILVKVMQPRATIRFATNVLFQVDDKGVCTMLVRMVNNTRYAIEHGSANVRIQVLNGPRHPPMQIEIPLASGAKTRLNAGENWVLQHVFDTKSPLEVAIPTAAEVPEGGVFSDAQLEDFFKVLAWVDVSLFFVDPVYGVDVRFLRRYWKSEVTTYAKFADMTQVVPSKKREDGSVATLMIKSDHANLDSIVEIPRDLAESKAIFEAARHHQDEVVKHQNAQGKDAPKAEEKSDPRGEIKPEEITPEENKPTNGAS
jgi:hypothetical protein